MYSKTARLTIVGPHFLPASQIIVFTCIKVHTFALSETPSFPSRNLLSVKSDIVDVYTRHSSFKVSSVTNPGSHSNWIISRKLYPANSSRSNDSAVQVEFGFTSVIVVSGCDVLPFIGFNTPRSKSWSRSAASSFCKTYE